jgi:hypothetical protein
MGVACVPKPRAHYSPEQLSGMHDTKELMRSLYHDLGPVWKSDKKSAFDAADYHIMVRVAPRVEAISAGLRTPQVVRRFPKGFTTPATALGQQGAALAGAARSATEPDARAAIKGINATCKSCHSRYK